LACLLGNISLVFSFISAFAVSALAFWFPGHYYLMSVKKFAQNKEPDAAGRRDAIILAAVGYFNCLIGLFSAVLQLMGIGGGGH
jgi:amino acid permease